MRLKKERFRRERIKKGWTMTELAKEAGVAISTICRLEQGKHIRSKTIHQTCRALGISVESVLSIRDRR